ncbi:MAG: hypothetical protein HKN44_04575 [Ilumatobacter sp.]|nr:hypothetical protein [Ilumatobacter sp.]
MNPKRNESLTRPTEFEFMPTAEWTAFNDRLQAGIVTSELKGATIEPGELVLADGRHLSVFNLAQLCHLSERSDWGALIDRHLTTLSAHVGGVPEPFSILDLRVRLLPNDQADHEVLELLGARPFAEGVVQTLAVQLNESVRSVPTSELEELGWDVDKCWAGAWAQTRTLARPEEANIVDVGGAVLVHLSSEHYFCSSFVPYLDDIVDGIGEHGALVSIPVRHSLIIHPIYDDAVLAAAGAMIPITRQLNLNGPGEVSAHLYWWRDGELTWIPTYFAHDGVEFYPPPELADLIRDLS